MGKGILDIDNGTAVCVMEGDSISGMMMIVGLRFLGRCSESERDFEREGSQSGFGSDLGVTVEASVWRALLPL